MTALMPALSGANIIYGLGLIELGMTFDYAQLLMDADMAKMVMFALGGIPVDDQTLSVDQINEVGSFKDFLSHKETFKHRHSQSRPELIDRRPREAWLKAGGRDFTSLALDRARQILETHEPKPLPDETRAALRRQVNQAEEFYQVPLSAE